MNIADLRVTADVRRHAGPVNALTRVPDAELPPLRLPEDYPEDYTDWQASRLQRDEPQALRGTDYEYRDGMWFDVRTRKRAYTWNERDEAIRLYESGVPARVVGEKFNAPAGTIRTWARRKLQGDFYSPPRFIPA